MANNFFGGYSPPQQYFQYQQPQQQNNTISVVTVQGEAGARIYPVGAGNTVFLIDFDNKKFWIKSTDTGGFPSRFAAFNFTEDVVQQQGNTSDFVTKDELADMKKYIDNQFSTLADIVKGAAVNVPTTFKQPDVSATVK